MVYVFVLLPTSVCEPVAVTTAVSPETKPSIEVSETVRAEPSYSLLPLSVVMVTVFGVTVSAPGTVITLVKLAVLSLPSASLIT